MKAFGKRNGWSGGSIMLCSFPNPGFSGGTKAITAFGKPKDAMGCSKASIVEEE